jgi:hypothetical protein
VTKATRSPMQVTKNKKIRWCPWETRRYWPMSTHHVFPV